MRQALLRDLRQSWAQLAATGIVYRLVQFTLLTPLVGLLATLLLTLSGRTVLADEDLLLVFLEPIGWIGLVVLGGATLAIAALEQASLMAVAFGTTPGRPARVASSLRYVAARWRQVLSLAVRLLIRVATIVLPFAAAAGLVYWRFLTEFDINYYLSQRPPAFWTAAVLIGAIVAVLALVLVPRLIGWAFVLPLLLFEDVGPREVFQLSSERTARRRWRVVRWLVGWALAGALLAVIATAAISLIAGVVVPKLGGSMPTLVVGLGALLLLLGVTQLAISLASAAAFALIVVSLYEHIGDGAAERTGWADAQTELRTGGRLLASPQRLLWGLVAAAVAACAVGWFALQGVELEERAEITAHRGASAAAPENSMAAIRRALDDGADWVEIDVQRTADDEVVVMHDRDFKKIAGVDLRVANATLEALADIDVGSWFDPRFASERIPTLAEVLESCRDRAGVNIELKYYGSDPRLAERVIEIVESEGMADQVVLMSLKLDAVEQVKRLRPEWTVGLLTAVALGDLTRIGADFLAVSSNLATRGFIRRAHGAGRPVHAWTVNDPIAMIELVGRGVDNLITDEPALARRLLDELAELDAGQRLLIQLGLLLDLDPPVDELEIARDAAPSSDGVGR